MLSGGHVHVAQQMATLQQLAGLSEVGWVLPLLKTEPKGNPAPCSTMVNAAPLIAMGGTFRVLTQASDCMPPKMGSSVPAHFIWKGVGGSGTDTLFLSSALFKAQFLGSIFTLTLDLSRVHSSEPGI